MYDKQSQIGLYDWVCHLIGFVENKPHTNPSSKPHNRMIELLVMALSDMF